MAVYLSPGVYTNEIDLSVIATAQSPLRPAFIGAAQKGPMNVPTLITSGSDFLNKFGMPFPESYLGYAVMSYLEEGDSCYVLRVGVECESGQVDDLADICIDTSGAKTSGWGRLPVFQGIDYGTIYLRAISASNPVILHAASTTFESYTGGATTAQITFSGTYTGCLDEIYTLTILTDPTDVSGGDLVDGCEFEITDSAGVVVNSGTLVAASDPSDSDPIALLDEDGASVGVDLVVDVGGILPLTSGDTFVFTAAPNNTISSVNVDNVAEANVTVATGTYNDATTFVAAYNAAVPGGSDHMAVVLTDADGNDVAALRTDDDGSWIQVTGSCAFCAELGISQYSYDIPRSYLLCEEEGPYALSSSNNRVVLDIIGSSETKQLDVTIPASPPGGSTPAATVAAIIDAAGLIDTVQYLNSYVITVPGSLSRILIISTYAERLVQLKLAANYTYLSTLRFADEVGIAWPYTRSYRGYSDARVELPEASSVNLNLPESCDGAGAGSAQCLLDAAYYENIVGWFVAPSAGTWVDDYRISVSVYDQGLGDAAGRFSVSIADTSGVVVEKIDDVTFNAADDRYIGNVINPGTTIGGINGNDYINWETRPSWLSDARVPGPFQNRAFAGAANGIPMNPIYSSELDRAVIGNPTLSTGIWALQNSESYDINLLLIPGFSTGTVIGQALQFCENRGDTLFLVDPPFGLRPQQVIDWHNGMLLSDLSSAINSSYGALYWSWVKVSDQYNGGTIWIPPSGPVSAVFARTARVSEQWSAPAGLNRGRLLTSLDTEYNPTLGERDALYGGVNAVNGIVNFVNEGIVVWGQKTLQRASTALDRVNVRMLLSFLKKSMGQSLKGFIFEINDSATRNRISNLLNGFMSDILSRRGVTAYKVVCDDSNNTPERIDRNELWVSVFIKPSRVAEFIVLNLVVLRSGAGFSATEVLAAGGVVQV